MSPELEVLKLVCERLEASDIPYMLTGSLASHFYAVPRMTRDIDIVIETLSFDVNRFLEIFQDDFYVSKGAVLEAIAREGMFNIIHNGTVFKVDFIVRKKSPYRLTEFQRRRRIRLDHLEAWVVSAEDLILSKLDWARESHSQVQLKDVGNLLAAVPQLDKSYLEQWVEKLQLQTVYEKAQAHGRHKP